MKILKITAIAICLIVFGSCKDNSSQTTHDSDRMDDNTPTMDHTGMGDANNQMDRTNSEMTLLYTELNMSPEQIDEFERREMEHRSNMNANNAQNQTQSDVDRTREQYLREILNNEQYQRYEQWKMDNTTRTNTNSGN